ncbi:MAG: hypothetical protein HMLIMOIP_002220 [Candidatus Nitrosomirales archaeon]|jgi:hypothetical protein
MADFGNGIVVIQNLEINFLVIPESPIGTIAVMLSSLAALLSFIGIQNHRKTRI